MALVNRVFYCLFIGFYIGMVSSCGNSKELLQTCQQDLQAGKLYTEALQINAHAAYTLYEQNNPTESFRLALQAWNLRREPATADLLLKAYYHHVFELEGAYHTTPFYHKIHTFNQTIYNAAFSANGGYVVADAGKNALLINTISGKMDTLSKHTANIYSVGFLPNRQYAYTTSEDFTAIIWDDSGNPNVQLKGHTAPVYDLHLSPDGNTFATAGWDGTARLWDWNGKLLQTITVGNNMEMLTIVRFAPNGKHLLLSDGVKLACFDLAKTAKPVFVINQNADVYTDAHFSPAETMIAAATKNGTIEQYDLQGKLLRSITPHNAPIRKIAFSPDGKLLLTASTDKTATVWHTFGNLVTTLSGHWAPLYQARFSADSQHIYTTSEDGTARSWAWKSGKILPLTYNPVLQSSFDAQNQLLYTVTANQTAQIWNTDGNIITNVSLPANTTSFSFTKPDKLYYASQNNYFTRVYDHTGSPVIVLNGNSAKGFNVWFAGGTMANVLSADPNGNAQLWDYSGKQLAQFNAHTDWLTNADFAPDAQLLATASYDRTAKLWNTNGLLLATLPGHARTVTTARFSKQNTHIVTASKDGRAFLWNITKPDNPTLQTIFAPYNGELYDAAFSPDARYIAIAGQNGKVSVYTQQGNLVVSFTAAPAQQLHQVAFNETASQTNQYLFTLAQNMPPLRWHVSPDALARAVQLRGFNPSATTENEWYGNIGH